MVKTQDYSFKKIYKHIYKETSGRMVNQTKNFHVQIRGEFSYNIYCETLEEAVKKHDIFCLKHNLPTIKNYKIINDNT